MTFDNFLTSLKARREQQPLNTVEPTTQQVELNEADLRSIRGGHHRHHRHHSHGYGYGYGYGYGCGYDDWCDYGDYGGDGD